LQTNVGFIRNSAGNWSLRQNRVISAFILWFALCISSSPAIAQSGRTAEAIAAMNSENGWHITTNGTVKVLMLFVEIDYDENPQDDPMPKGHHNWMPRELPAYADDVFDAEVLGEPRAMMTRYYHFSSLGNLRVLGDYYHETITLKESEVGRLNLTTIKRAITDRLHSPEMFIAGNGSSMESFDLWKRDTRPGMPRINEPDDPFSFDHVMMFLRNFHGLRKDNGSASGSTFGTLFGLRSDTYSQFNGGHDLPDRILRHEFNHLLLGANNFHCCGGGSTVYNNYFIPGIHGWGLMGSANSSFSICNAWDRHRLGWKQPGKKFLLSTLSRDGVQELNSELHADSSAHQGYYLLRDFATTGDAMQITLPHIPENQYRQYLWIANHQTSDRNGVEFDQFRFQDREGMTKASPGLYMMLQVDKDTKTGSGVFGGLANYLRPVLANGRYDVQWTKDSLRSVISRTALPVHRRPEKMKNPLTGSQDMEAVSFNKDPQDSTLEFNDILDPWIEAGSDGQVHHAIHYGHERQAFRLDGNSRIGLGSNPSSASLVSFASGRNVPRTPDARNNHSTYLNGISVEIVEERSDGSILVNVRFDDTAVTENTRWCSDTIVVSNNPHNDIDLEIAERTSVLVDHGETATRRTDPTLRKGKQVFVSPTTMVFKPGTHTVLRRKSRLIVDNCSQLIVQPGARITIEKGAQIILKNGTEMHAEPGAIIENQIKGIKIRKGSQFVQHETRR